MDNASEIALEVRDLAIGYGERTVLQDLKLNILI